MDMPVGDLPHRNKQRHRFITLLKSPAYASLPVIADYKQYCAVFDLLFKLQKKPEESNEAP